MHTNKYETGDVAETQAHRQVHVSFTRQTVDCLAAHTYITLNNNNDDNNAEDDNDDDDNNNNQKGTQ